MPDMLKSQSLTLFLNDLVAIREKKSVTLDDIRAKTKVYPHIIAQFETDGLCDHPLFNSLYVKAFARSYAAVLGISPNLVAQSYEAALKGVYRRELAIEYLGYEPEPDDEAEEHIVEVELPQPSAESIVTENASIPSNHAYLNRSAILSGHSHKNFSAGLKETYYNVSDRILNTCKHIIHLVSEKGFIQWGIMAGCIVVGIVLILRIISFQSTDVLQGLSQSTTIQGASVKRDENEAVQMEEERGIGLDSQLKSVDGRLDSVDRREGISNSIKTMDLADSLHVVIVASTGKLDPFRIKVDTDLRRPYWLDVGDSMVFRMGDRVIIEDNLESMRVMLEGKRYPIYDTDSTASVVINKDTARAFLNVRLN